MYFRWLLREWKSDVRITLLFIFNLSLGLIGFAGLLSIKTALQQDLQLKSKSILSADLAVSARRPLMQQEIEIVEKHLPTAHQVGEVLEFFSMASGATQSRLVQVKVIDDAYPFYGKMELQSGALVTGTSSKQDLQLNGIWVYPEILTQFELQMGQSLRLGNLDLKIAGVVVDDSTQTFRMGALAPKVYIHKDLLKASGLLAAGSTVSYARLYKVAGEFNAEEVLLKIEKELPDNSVRVDSPQSAAEDTGRVIKYLNDYLGLAALVGFLLAQIGGIYLFRSLLSKKLKDIAIFRCLGLQSKDSIRLYALYIVSMGAVAGVLSLVASGIGIKFLLASLGDFLPKDFVVQIGLVPAVATLLIATLGGLLGSWPLIVSLREVKIGQLWTESFQSEVKLRWRQTIYFLPAIVMIVLLTVFVSNSYKVSSIFLGSMVSSFFILGIIGWLFFEFLGRRSRLPYWPLRHAFLFLSRKKASSLLAFVTIGIGTLLVSLIPQVKTGIAKEVSLDRGSKIPSLFLFDIQEEQIQKLQSFFVEKGRPLENVSPMVRARLLTLNDEPFERALNSEGFKTREEETEARFRNRGFNLSYRPNLGSHEQIVEGIGFSATIGEVAELSLEKKFAERLGVKLGDRLKFDVQGVEVLGKVINFRSVKWTSFQPNFFVLFQPGFLDAAPKTFIGSLPAMPALEREQLQMDLVKSFANVSVVDITRAVSSLLDMLTKMSGVLELMAYLTLIAGFVVIFSICLNQIQARAWDVNLLKVMGGRFSEISIFFVSEYAVLSLMAAFIGSLLSLALSWGLSVFVFNGEASVNFMAFLLPIGLVTLISSLIAFLTSQKVIQARAKETLAAK